MQLKQKQVFFFVAILSTTVTNNGQITLPEEIRQYLKLASGSRVEFVIDEDGQVKIFPLIVTGIRLSQEILAG